MLVFLFLIVTIIFTPLLVTRGFSYLSEEMLESALLFAQVAIAWNVFRLYEEAMKSREAEIGRLEEEYQKRERELIETFAYLGKVNVQMSLIKDFLGKLKAPASRSEVKGYIGEILNMALSISQRDWITLRIINPERCQTVSEYWSVAPSVSKKEEMRIGNKDILKMAREKRYCNDGGYCVVSSAGATVTGLKTFLVFEENDVDREILDFLSAAVNQCEIIYTLFELRHAR